MVVEHPLGSYAVIDIDHESAAIQFFTETGQLRTDAGVPVAPDQLARLE